MKEIHSNFSYRIYKSSEKLERSYIQLIREADEAIFKSYSPYSKFRVGAALILENNIIIQGANQENASYPLCMCAERVALYSASIAYPKAKIVALAVTARAADNQVLTPVPPCGACRQVIAEYEKRQRQDITILLKGTTEEIHMYNGITSLLPKSFNGDYLP